MNTSKLLKREVNIINLTSNNLKGDISNLIKYKEVEYRNKIFWLHIGVKRTVREVDNKYYDCIKHISNNYDVIITGSCALDIYGLLKRDIGNDVDIIASQ